LANEEEKEAADAPPIAEKRSRPKPKYQPTKEVGVF
jgi:hypothetical protein